MTSMQRVLGLALALSACSDDDVPHQDGGSEADAGLDGGAEPCAIGSRVVGTFGPRGGRLSLCGARVEMAANVLSAPREVTLTTVALEREVPFPLVQAGLAFDIEVEGGIPSAAQPPLSVLVPHERTERYVYFYRVADDYQGIEACTVQEGAIGQSVYEDGIYVALADTETFPESRQGLGTGSVSAIFDGVERTFDLDGTGFDTYAIYNEDQAGGRTFTLSATESVSEAELRVMRMTFAVDVAGSHAEFIEVTYGDLNGLYGYLPFDDGPASITLTASQGTKVQGAFEVELRLGEERKTLRGRFDAEADKYRYPPELSCGAPPEG